jgi:Spy/CpxP family protein refolding chaperone
MIRKQQIITIAIIAAILFFTAIDQGWAQEERGVGHGRDHQRALFRSELTEEQQTELHEMIRTLRDEGAGHEAVRDSVHAKFEEWGIDTPDFPAFPKFHGVADPLTDEQRTELDALMKQARENGKSANEIHEAVRAKLDEWGIEPLGEHGPRPPRGEHPRQPDHFSGPIRGMNHPNPFHPETVSGYTLKEAGNITVSIFNAQGERVREFDAGYQQAGPFQIIWDGKSDSGKNVPSGMYVYKIQAGNEEFTGRMLMMK